MSMREWGPKMAPCCSLWGRGGRVALLLYCHRTWQPAWRTKHESHAVTSTFVSAKVPQLNTKLPSPPFFIHLCVKFVFHVKYILFFSNHIFADFLLVLHVVLAHPPSVSPFWRTVHPALAGTCNSTRNSDVTSIQGPRGWWFLEARYQAHGSPKALFIKWCSCFPISRWLFLCERLQKPYLEVNTNPILFVF